MYPENGFFVLWSYHSAPLLLTSTASCCYLSYVSILLRHVKHEQTSLCCTLTWKFGKLTLFVSSFSLLLSTTTVERATVPKIRQSVNLVFLIGILTVTSRLRVGNGLANFLPILASSFGPLHLPSMSPPYLQYAKC